MRLPTIPNIPQDKAGHFLVGQGLALIGVLITVLVRSNFGVDLRIWPSLLLNQVFAIGKEVYDHFHPETHTCDFYDWLATTIGGLPIWVSSLY